VRKYEEVGTYVLTVILSLAAGAIVGYLGLLGSKARLAGPLASAGVILLLFLMGAKIGFDEEIMGSLAVMGLQALAYAVATIAGSILLVWLWQLVEKRRQKGEAEREEA